MYFLLKIGIFHCYVSLPEGSLNILDLRVFTQIFEPSNCSTSSSSQVVPNKLTTYWHFGWRVTRGVFRFLLAFLRSLDYVFHCFTGMSLSKKHDCITAIRKKLGVKQEFNSWTCGICWCVLFWLWFMEVLTISFSCDIPSSRETGIWLDVPFAAASTRRECSQKECCMVLSKRYGTVTWIAPWFWANFIAHCRLVTIWWWWWEWSFRYRNYIPQWIRL